MGDADRQKRRLARALLVLGGLLVLLVGYLLVVRATGRGIPCFLYRLTGRPCGSCGLTRALGAAVALDLTAAFAYHPLWPVYVAYALWVGIADAAVYVRRGVLRLLPDPLWIHVAMVVLVTAYGILRQIL